MKKCLAVSLIISAIALSTGCQNTGEEYSADVYDTSLVNQKQETKTVKIISVLPAKVAVDNKQNKKAASLFGTIIGATLGGIAGHNIGTGSALNTTAGGVLGGGAGALASAAVKDKVLVEGVSLTYKEGTKIYTSSQVGKLCQFKIGTALVITMKTNETRIQPNATCPVPVKK